MADVADSLAAVKKLVFDEKALSFPKLKQVLDSDFEEENVRQLLINRAPKYGNDEDFVDALAKATAAHYCKAVRRYKNPRGGTYRPGLYSVAGHVPLGQAVGALPNGRKAGTGLADGISPSHGCDRRGLSALVKSAAKIDHLLASNGTNLNPKLHPTILRTDEEIAKLILLLRAFTGMGCLHIQFNVVDSATLREAQAKPEEYRGLLVRVSGYSSFFVDLDANCRKTSFGEPNKGAEPIRVSSTALDPVRQSQVRKRAGGRHVALDVDDG